jgi:hypothetical protein
LQVVNQLTTRRHFLSGALALSGALSMLPLLAPDGHLTFIAFRRNSATNADDRAEVRVIARVAREIGFDSRPRH